MCERVTCVYVCRVWCVVFCFKVCGRRNQSWCNNVKREKKREKKRERE